MENRILIYGDVILNIIDGSSIWLINLSKLIAQDKSNQVDILLKKPIKNDVLVCELEEYSNVRLIQTEMKEITKDNIQKAIGELDNRNHYQMIIVRGLDVVRPLISSNLKTKVVPYLTDFNQDMNTITNDEKNELSLIYNSFDKIFVQTEEMKEYYMKILNVDGDKCSILYPIVFPVPPVEKENKTICYAGQLSDLWKTEELIEIMEILYEKDPEIKLYFIGKKFTKKLNKKHDEIIDRLKSGPNINYIPELPNNESRKIINKCKLGYCFRSEKLDNDSQLEISVKFLEYGNYNVAPLVRKTKMHSKILGEDYLLYVSNVQECVDKILYYFNTLDGEINIDLAKSFKRYNPDEIYKNIKLVIDYYHQKSSKSTFKKILDKLF